MKDLIAAEWMLFTEWRYLARLRKYGHLNFRAPTLSYIKFWGKIVLKIVYFGPLNQDFLHLVHKISHKVEGQLDLQYFAGFSPWKIKNWEIWTNFGQKMAKNTKMWFNQKHVWIYLKTTKSARNMKFGMNITCQIL